jgi:hypothetical protein
VLLLCVPSVLPFRRWPTPPQCPVTHFPQTNGSRDCLLCDLQLYGLPEDPAECCPASHTCCCLEPRILILEMPSSFSDLSSRTSVLSGFSVQSCPCLVPDDSDPYAVQEWHGGTSLCRRRPTSTRTLGPFLRLSAAPVLQCCDSFHRSLFLRDFLMLRLGLYLFRICLSLYWICLRRSSVGLHLFSSVPHIFYDLP